MTILSRFEGLVRQSGALSPDVWRRLPDLLFPPRCLACEVPVSEVGALCGDCWLNVTFVDGAMCDCCGQPFELDPGPNSLCPKCIASPPIYTKARAVFVYDEASRPLVTGFKYGDRTDRVPGFGRWLARAGRDLIGDSDLIVPVPLHRWRLLSRRFNQSALLAQALSRETLLPVLAEGLVRHRPTQQQVGLTHAKRRRNVRGAFAVDPRQAAKISGQRILLIDDVVTSGATIEACVRALTKAGAERVHVLALARVAPGRPER